MIEHVQIINPITGEINQDEYNRAELFLQDYVNGLVRIERPIAIEEPYQLPVLENSGTYEQLNYIINNLTEDQRLLTSEQYNYLKDIIRGAIKGLINPQLINQELQQIVDEPTISVSKKPFNNIVEFYNSITKETLWITSEDTNYKVLIPFREHPKSESCATDIWLHYGFVNDRLLNYQILNGEPLYYEDLRVPYPIILSNTPGSINTLGYCNGLWPDTLWSTYDSISPKSQLNDEALTMSLVPSAPTSQAEYYGRQVIRKSIKTLKFIGTSS